MSNPIQRALNNFLIEPISRQVSTELAKQTVSKSSPQEPDKPRPVEWDVPMTFNMFAGGKKKKKPGGSINPQSLRQFAEFYPIARACINYLKAQTTKLEWDIGPKEKDQEDANPTAVKEIKNYFEQPCGHKSRLRELLGEIVEDVMVLDAVSLYMRRTYGGQFMHLVPIDAGTIKLKVNEFGGTPEPPEIAYEQWINGSKIAEMTTNDMIYERLSPRTDNIYGRAPLESLIVEVESALRGSLYNLKYLEEGNDPEGFGVLPEGWTQKQISEFQTYWDSLLSGNMGIRRRMKFVPAGFQYIPSKKPEDMAFEKFELWLLQKTCAVFGVPPQDIGFTYQVNKSTGEVQERLGKARSLYPITNFIKEIFDDIIQKELGYANLAWLWTDIDPMDEEKEAKIFETQVKLGAKSVDEYRREKGMEEIGLDHFIMTPKGPVLVEDVLSGDYNPFAQPTMQEEEDIAQRDELVRWRRCCINDLKSGRDAFRKFDTTAIDPDIYKEIESLLKSCSERWQIKKVFEPYLSSEARLVGKAAQLGNELNKLLKN